MIPADAALIPWLVTYSDAHRPDGTLVKQNTSAQDAAARHTETVYAPTAQAATDMYERDWGRMVTGCKRMEGQVIEKIRGGVAA